jgi:hypothetical protein
MFRHRNESHTVCEISECRSYPSGIRCQHVRPEATLSPSYSIGTKLPYFEQLHLICNAHSSLQRQLASHCHLLNVFMNGSMYLLT